MPVAPELDQQIQRHEGYLARDAANLPLRLTLADLLHRAGRLDEALAYYAQCLELSPGHAAARSGIASVRITQHRFADAESLLREVLDEGDGSPALLHNLGLALYYQERFAQAGECFGKAAAAGLQEPSNDAYLARSFHHQGEMAQAIDAGRRWALKAPGAASKSYLALLYMDSNDTAAASELALEVLAEEPGNVDANVVSGVALTEKQDMARARRHFEAALAREPDNGRAWLGLGLARLYEEDHAGAIDALQRATRIYPDNSGMAVALGWAHLSAKDPATAEAVFARAVELDRNFAESHGGLAAALAMQQKIEAAQEAIKVAVRLDKQNFGAQYARSAILAINGKEQAAGQLLAHIFRQAPGNSAVPLMEQLRIHAARKAPPPRPGKS